MASKIPNRVGETPSKFKLVKAYKVVETRQFRVVCLRSQVRSGECDSPIEYRVVLTAQCLLAGGSELLPPASSSP